MNLLIKNATVVLPDGQTKTANIAVEGSKILAIGEAPADFIASTGAVSRRSISSANSLPSMPI